MSAWGAKTFDNDEAVEFLETFEDQPRFSLLRSAIENVITDDFIEIDSAQQAIAALEIIAVIKGNVDASFPGFETLDLDTVQETFEDRVNSDFIQMCDDALETLCRNEDNELYEYFEEENELEAFIDSINQLKERVLE